MGTYSTSRGHDEQVESERELIRRPSSISCKCWHSVICIQPQARSNRGASDPMEGTSES